MEFYNRNIRRRKQHLVDVATLKGLAALEVDDDPRYKRMNQWLKRLDREIANPSLGIVVVVFKDRA